jgi:hypothetical protein
MLRISRASMGTNASTPAPPRHPSMDHRHYRETDPSAGALEDHGREWLIKPTV